MARAPWQAVAALVDQVRRALYDYVRSQDHPVTREEAADAQHISRSLAAFHLDKLVGAGLLQTRYEAPTDQARGRGRTPKVYEAAPGCISLTIPERRYDLIGEILAQAVAQDPADARSAALRLAEQRGVAIGHGVDGGGSVVAVLAELGFDPADDDERIRLRNCPFHEARRPADRAGVRPEPCLHRWPARRARPNGSPCAAGPQSRRLLCADPSGRDHPAAGDATVTTVFGSVGRRPQS